MRVRAYIWLLFLAEVILSCVFDVSADESESDEFVPTREWQEVKPGQHIPAGLHIRMDLEKGGRWAKLMEDEGKGEKSISVVGISDEVKRVPVTGTVDNLDIADLKIALKKLKNDQVIDEQQMKEEDIAGKFRSMDEIKEAFDELHLQEETDFEVMQRLLKKYHQEETSLEEKILILKDLEIYVHQVDNAVDFIKLNGLQTMVAELNNTENQVRAEAAHVIGSAVQSNPAVQIKAVESGALSLLVRIITNTKETEETRKKALYAVSCLIRRLPAAQYMFRNVGGFSALATCIHEHGSEKLRYKAISLLNDLIVERNEQILIEEPNQNDKERERQLKLFVLSDEIQPLGTCTTIINLLETNEHDQREILITFMEHAHEICLNTPRYKTEVYNALHRYEKEYKDLADEEELEGDYDSYFHVMHTSVVDLMQLMEDDNAGFDHDEL